ncbi:putative phosphatase regulatory subunit-domain-containing protein [Russula vinacea]|nr:putative phosphatase regulatory subunit-domain-containing protein [Russula vinacea]
MSLGRRWHQGKPPALARLFLASLLKDIKLECPKIREKYNLCLLFFTKLLKYFLAIWTQEKSVGASEPWAFRLIGEVIKRSWIVWVLKRMNGAVEEKPKSWKELQVGIECLTLLAFLKAMASMNREAGAGEDSKDSTRPLLYFSNNLSTMARSSVLHLMACVCGTILVRNIVFEKHVGVRFTLNDWMTVRGTRYVHWPSRPTGDASWHPPRQDGCRWDRFNFAIKLEDHEAYLWQSTLFLVTRFSAPSAGEFWDNNFGENYRITFHLAFACQPGAIRTQMRHRCPLDYPFPYKRMSGLTSRFPRLNNEPQPTFASPQ